jgi:cell division protein FtsW
MSKSNSQPPAFVLAITNVLDRPLASYQIIIGTTSLLLSIGLVMVLSASSVNSLVFHGNSYYIIIRQLIFAGLGIIGFVFFLRFPLSHLRRFIPFFLYGVVGLIGLTFVPGIGHEVNGNRNWLPLPGGFNIQPSEFAKLAIVLFLADMYTRTHKRLKDPKFIIGPAAVYGGIVTAFVVFQKDLGTALVIMAVIVGMMWVVGLPLKFMGGVVATLIVLLVFLIATAPHRVARMLTFLDPLADPEHSGYQAVKAMMGFATGGFWGVGLGGSRQKWGALPEAHTDFIMAVIGEELGLAGSLVIVILFLILGFAGFRVAMRSQDRFARYVAAGITIWIMVQAMVNIAMVLGLLPVIGIPLPLISYGGSSLLVTLAALGLLANCATTEPGAERALRAARRSTPGAQRREAAKRDKAARKKATQSTKKPAVKKPTAKKSPAKKSGPTKAPAKKTPAKKAPLSVRHITSAPTRGI